MIAQVSAALYPWSKDLEASSDVRQREQAAFAMLLGWMEKFVCGKGLQPGRAACERFWKESVMARGREAWQIEQWALLRCATPWQALARSGVLRRLVRSGF